MIMDENIFAAEKRHLKSAATGRFSGRYAGKDKGDLFADYAQSDSAVLKTIRPGYS